MVPSGPTPLIVYFVLYDATSHHITSHLITSYYIASHGIVYSVHEASLSLVSAEFVSKAQNKLKEIKRCRFPLRCTTEKRECCAKIYVK